MYSNIREFIIDVVKKSTALGLAKYPKKKKEVPEKDGPKLSDKALKAKAAIEEGDFGGYEDSVAGLTSAILGEEIVIDNSDEDDFDTGREITVPCFSLLVCIHDTEDDDDANIDEGELILKSSNRVIEVSDVYDTPPTDLLSRYNQYYYISEDGESDYIMEHCGENEFRFATEKEIEKFVKKLPKDSLKFWFGELTALFNVLFIQTDK